MGNDSANPASLEEELKRLRERLQALEELVAKQTGRIYALEIEARHTKSTPPSSEVSPMPPQAKVVSSDSVPPRPAASASSPGSVLPTRTKPAEPLASPGATSGRASLEARIGGNWLLWVGIVAIVLGTVYFLKLAFENNWIGPSGRVAIGILFGTGFFLWGEALQKHQYPYYGQIVTGGGGAILYLSAYAAFNYYHLVPSWFSFFFMILVTAAIGVLAARYTSRSLAFIGLVGGFLTPYWLSTGEDHQIILLSYVTLLVAGIAFLARRQRWMVLNITSYVFTILLFGEWAVVYYSHEKRWTTELYLWIFAALFFYIGWEMLQKTQSARRNIIKEWVGLTLFLLYFCSSINLFRNGVELFSFMLVFDAVLLILAMRVRLTSIGLAALVMNIGSFYLWLNLEYDSEHLASTLAFLSVFYLFFLAWPAFFLMPQKAPAQRSDLIVTTGNAFCSFAGAYFLLNQNYQGILGLLAVALGGLYFGLARFFWVRLNRDRRLILILLGVAITFVTLTIPIQLKQNWITLSWALEALVLTGVAVRTSSRRMHYAVWVVLGCTVLRLFLFDMVIPAETFLLILNKRFFTFLTVIVVCYGIAWMLRKAAMSSSPELAIAFRALILLASFLSVVLMTLEASSFYAAKRILLSEQLRANGTRFYDFNEIFRPVENARQVAYSVIWGVYSVILIVVGILKRFRDVRLFAMGLFALTIAKVFLVDLASLERVYRVLSMTALGAILLLAAYLYQHYRRVIL